MTAEERLEDIVAWGNRLNPSEARALLNGGKMSEQDRLKEIAKVAADATANIINITKTLADNNEVINDLSELAYQLGYIEGLSYVPEEGEE